VMFNKNGRAVTFDQLKKVKDETPMPDDVANAPSQKSAALMGANPAGAVNVNSPGEKLFALAKAANGFEMGQANAPVAQIFIDPMCPHCKEMLSAVWPAIDAGMVRLRVIPVGAVAPQSQGMAAYLLRAPDAPNRLRKLMGGDMSAVPSDSDAPTAPIMDNTKILIDWKLNSVPITLYRGRDGKVKLLEGPPTDLETFLKDLT
jgi:thiol:disulfide interchange protein DsbG